MPARVLSIGTDSLLQKTRCAALRSACYETQAVLSHNADGLLQAQRFDLVILSMLLTEAETRFTQEIRDKTKILRLESLAPAGELLKAVEPQLALN